MNWISISKILAALTIALGITETFAQATPQSKMTFSCNLTSDPPITLANLPDNANPIPMITWYSEYLLPENSAKELCQKVAETLQEKYNQQQNNLFATGQETNRNIICLVSSEGEKCNSNQSQELFSVQPEYDPRCVMDNIAPGECGQYICKLDDIPPLACTNRGTVLAIPGGKYKPSWLPFLAF